MALWADKYRPLTLSDLTYHHDVTENLNILCESDGFPHLLVYGPSGAGKKTRIMAVLRALFGQGVDKIKTETRVVTNGSKKVEIQLILSNYHLELSPGDVGTQDRIVVQELIKELGQTQNIDAASKNRFKVVIISDADSLSIAAQHALRRTMEKYMANLRIIMCCTSTSKIIPAVQSRCLLIRVPAPSHDSIINVLANVSQMNDIKVNIQFLQKISNESQRNLRRALMMLQALYVSSPGNEISENDSIIHYDWEIFIRDLAQLMVKEQTPESLLKVREKLYSLLSHCIPPQIILKTLCFSFIEKIHNSLRPLVAEEAAFYDQTMRMGSKPIYHLEAFAAKVMYHYKKHCFEQFG